MSNYPDQQLSDLTNLRKINGFDEKIFGEGFTKLKNLKTISLLPCLYKRLTNETFMHLTGLPITFIQLKRQIHEEHKDTVLLITSLNSLDTYEHENINSLPLCIFWT